MDLTNVYNQILILFMLMIGGYIFSKLKLITQESVENFTTYIVKIAMPALIISGMMISKTPEKLKASAMILFISICIYTLTFFMAKIVPRTLQIHESERGIYEFALMFSNVGFMGFPVIEAIFGKDAVFFTAIYNIPFNVLVYTIGISMVSTPNKKAKVDIKAFINPGVLASIIGFMIFLFSIELPEFISGSVTLIGSTTTPISMIVIGAMLSSFPIKEMFTNYKVYVISAIRIFIWPLVIFFIFRFALGIEDTILVGVPVIIAGMPVATNAALIVQEYGEEPQVASQSIFITTVGSLITIPLLSLLFF